MPFTFRETSPTSSLSSAITDNTSKNLVGLLSFRPLNRSDFPLLQRWLSEPHVDAWWHEPLDFVGLEDKYGPRIDEREPTYVFVIEYGRRPIGWIQWYRWSDYLGHSVQLGAELETAGIDLAIGEPEMIGLGLDWIRTWASGDFRISQRNRLC